MEPERNRILDELERMKEDKLYRWFVKRMQPLEVTMSPRSASAPWELIIWVYKETKDEDFKKKMIQCAERLLDNILRRNPVDIIPAEVYHLSLIISHLEIRQLKDQLRDLAERECICSIEYQGIDIREQILYHLESLGHLDLTFWKKEVESLRFAGSSFLAMTRIGKKMALQYLPHLIEASITPNGIPLSVILQIALERPGMEGFCEKIIDLFSSKEMPTELPPIFKSMDEIGKAKHWEKYRELIFRELEQLDAVEKDAAIHEDDKPHQFELIDTSNGINIYEKSGKYSSPCYKSLSTGERRRI